MKLNIEEMLDDYTIWLRNEITVANFGEYQELTTPYLDRHNDYLQIYVKAEENGNIILTDDGYIISNLNMSGIKFIKNSSRKQRLDSIISNYGLTLVGDDIVATCTIKNFPKTKHMMLQALLLIDDIFQTNRENTKNFFLEDLSNFFDTNKMYPIRDFTLLGKTGSLYTYDFVFNRTEDKPERYCRCINKLSSSNRNMAIFNWIDTTEKRGDRNSKLYIIINDKNTVKDEDIEALNNYNIVPIMYSDLDKNKIFFSA